MRNEKYRVNNPAFNEFVYSLLYNASIDVKRIIPPRFLKFIKYEREAKKFIRTANTDEARTLLSCLGVEHFMVFIAKDNVDFKGLKAILDKLQDNRKVSALQDLIDHKIFVTSDKELITLLGLTAQNIHHKAYTMRLELTRTGYHPQHWKKHLDADSSQEIQENSNALAKTLLSSSLTLERCEFLFRLKPLHVQLLLHMYSLKHTFVSAIQLLAVFEGYQSKVKIGYAIKNILRDGYIQKSAVDRDPQYTISGRGIKVVNEYMEAVLHANGFR